MSNTVTMKGNPLSLSGNEIEVGQKAPDFEVVDNDMGTKNLASFQNKVCVVLTVPSLDTPVCDTEVRKFNEKASNMGPDIVIMAVSMDLPFAQKRWCGSAGVERVITFSDYKNASFGNSYGVLIEALRLLARSVFIIDKNGVVQYKQIVKEVTEEPDYEDVLKALEKLS